MDKVLLMPRVEATANLTLSHQPIPAVMNSAVRLPIPILRLKQKQHHFQVRAIRMAITEWLCPEQLMSLLLYVMM